MNKKTYTGSKIQNHFTAYLIQFVRPEWNKMSDERLMKALHTLRDEERKLIYQHVFEERSFEEMSRLNGLSEERCKGIYYYAIRKIRKVMGGEN